ncbi:MAG: magnesium and cobalt transport protein CorA [Microbacterium sp.]|uniref:magnesium and cobalt transport protein CorA n=1 Tax=Microbacterium sp. TaxID=51671 RepID=UPI00261FD872|nr:magnesium and cobalt transport protein CorA [Microbacterium sp.]MCX6502713.1 magnesium and cobalt transport protein CorA [Microbacterium sp.]
MPIIDNAVYVAGKRIRNPDSLDQTFEYMRDQQGMAWIGLLRPTEGEVRRVASEFSLHPLAVEDALAGHQRAKLERYGEVLFAVLRPVRYVDSTETVEFGELHIFVGPDFVVTIRRAALPNLARVRQRLEHQPDLLSLGPEAVLYAIVDEVVDEYAPVIEGIQGEIDQIEDELYTTGDAHLSRRIYVLSREIIQFQRALEPLQSMLAALQQGSGKHPVDIELQRLLRDVHDHALRTTEKLTAQRAILQNALTLNATLVTLRHTEAALAQNEQVKRISAWAAILFAPTLVGTVYGMNFTFMPELQWTWGYPFALSLMAGTSLLLWRAFRWRKWL